MEFDELQSIINAEILYKEISYLDLLHVGEFLHNKIVQVMEDCFEEG